MKTNETESPNPHSSAEDVKFIPPIIPLPPGALDDAYDEEDILLENIWAKASVTALDPQDDPDNG